MKLIELADFLTNRDGLALLIRHLGLEDSTENILIYMEGRLDLDSELRFFQLSETDDDIIFNQDGIRYVQLFPLEYMFSLAQFDLDLVDKDYSPQGIAQRLLDYRVKDA